MTHRSKALSFIFYILSVLVLTSSAILRAAGSSSPLTQLAVLIITSALIYIGGVYMCRGAEDPEKIIKRHLWVIFILYIMLLVNFTIFDGSFGRVTGKVLSSVSFAEYFGVRGNIVPFRMIYRQTKALIAGNYSLKNYVVNIAGNLAAFAPFALFLPLLFGKMRKFMFFFLTTSAVILLVETIQLLTRVGSYDIDDYILNILGASLTFALLSSSPGKKLKQKIMHPISETEQNKDKK